MKSVTYHEFGSPDVFAIQESEIPIVKEAELLIRVKAVAVTAGEMKARSLEGVGGLFWLPARLIFGFSKPRYSVLGCYYAGIVEKTGPSVTTFSPGDRVSGFKMFGCNSEYIVVGEKSVVIPLAESLSFADIAVAPFGLSTANACLEYAGITRNTSVLVNGASGGVGLAAVQLSKHYGASVSGTCSRSKMDLVSNAGADHVVDYHSLDSLDTTFDLILDTSGKLSFTEARELLSPKGVLHLIDFGGKDLLQSLYSSVFSSQKVKCHVVGDYIKDMELSQKLLLSGAFKPIIDKSYPLEDLAEAHRHFESGNKKGNIVIEML